MKALVAVALAGCAVAPASDATQEDALSSEGGEDLGTAQAGLGLPPHCFGKMLKPAPLDDIQPIGQLMTLRVNRQCDLGAPLVDRKIRIYARRYEVNGTAGPQQMLVDWTDWPAAQYRFEAPWTAGTAPSSSLGPGRWQIFSYVINASLYNDWLANDPYARNMSRRSDNTYVELRDPGTWMPSAWSTCSVECGGGTQSRTNACQDSGGTPLEGRMCVTPAPDTAQSCNVEACPPEAPPDLTAPVLTSATPAAGAAGVHADASLSATFDEPLSAQSTATLKRGNSTDVLGTTSVDGNTITFTPTSAMRLTVSTYTVTFNAVDAAGNTASTSITFSTRDATAPALSTSYPAVGETGIPKSVNATAQYNEAITSQSSVTLTKVSNGASISGVTRIDANTTLVFDPDVMLESNTAYKAVFTVYDAAGNQTTSEVQFTTGTSTF